MSNHKLHPISRPNGEDSVEKNDRFITAPHCDRAGEANTCELWAENVATDLNSVRKVRALVKHIYMHKHIMYGIIKLNEFVKLTLNTITMKKSSSNTWQM